MNEPTILFENDDCLVINKPSGLLVHASEAWNYAPDTTLVDWLSQHAPGVLLVGDSPERPGIVHRLDKETSGVMVIAKTQPAFEYFKKLFQERAIKKTYLAIVFGVPKEKKGVINAAISIKDGTTRRTVFKGKMKREAVTDYELAEAFGGFSLIRAFPHTGRTHQIRVHLASIGHPITGDTFYGRARAKQPEWAPRVMLHAFSLEAALPSGQRMKFEAEPPEDFSLALVALRNRA